MTTSESHPDYQPGNQAPVPLTPEEARLHERFGVYASAIHEAMQDFHGPYTGEAYSHHEFLGVGLIGSHEEGPRGESWLVKVTPRRAHTPAGTSYEGLVDSATQTDSGFREWTYSSTQPDRVLTAGLGISEVSAGLIQAMRRTAVSVARGFDNEDIAARIEAMDED